MSESVMPMFSSKTFILSSLTFRSLGFPDSSVGKESACNAGDLGSIPGLGRFPGEVNGYHSSILAWRGAWQATVHRVSKGWT